MSIIGVTTGIYKDRHMNKIIEKLSSEVDVNSVVAAGHYVNTFTNNDWPKTRFDDLIRDMFDVEPDTTFQKESEVLFRYMVIESVKMHVAKIEFDSNTLLLAAKQQVLKFIEQFPWVSPTHSSQLAKSNFDEDGNYIGEKGVIDVSAPADIMLGRTQINGKIIKPKKGMKQVAAKAIYDANIEKSNQEIIKLFMTQLDMTKSGATTYLYSCKKNSGALNEKGDSYKQ
jgi:hypothetical protein